MVVSEPAVAPTYGAPLSYTAAPTVTPGKAAAPAYVEAPTAAAAAPAKASYGEFQKSLGTFPVKEKEILLPGKYTADPSAHVVDGRVVVWTSHDVPVTTTAEDETQFMMKDYQMLSFNKDMTEVTDHGFVLPLSSVPWYVGSAS